MPDEKLIIEIEGILDQVVELGAERERTRFAPNLLVTDGAPANLSDYIVVRDDRDGDNILALRVPDVIYNTNDLVNVLFIKGGEAVAFQQGSGSSSSGIWSTVPSTSTDIFYNSGDVGIGKAVAPDARLEVLDASQAQLRLTHTEDVDFVDFQIDTNADLTITPSGTGQIILQPTTDSTDFFQVLDADGGTPVLDVDSANERVGIGTASPSVLLDVGGSAGIVASFGDGSNSTQIAIDGSAAQPRDLLLQTGGVNRWILRADATAEGGSNAGSNFTLLARADDGSNLATAFFIRRSNQQFGMGVANPAAKLDISQTNGGAAVPVIKMNQLDVDEPFFLCRSAAASGVLTRTLVDVGDVSTFTAVGYFKIEIDDTGNQITDGDYYVEFGSLA